jgi:hypothetical protein
MERATEHVKDHYSDSKLERNDPQKKRKDQNCLEPAPATDGNAAPTTNPGHQRRSTGLEKVSL